MEKFKLYLLSVLALISIFSCSSDTNGGKPLDNNFADFNLAGTVWRTPVQTDGGDIIELSFNAKDDSFTFKRIYVIEDPWIEKGIYKFDSPAIELYSDDGTKLFEYQALLADEDKLLLFGGDSLLLYLQE